MMDEDEPEDEFLTDWCVRQSVTLGINYSDASPSIAIPIVMQVDWDSAPFYRQWEIVEATDAP